MNISSKASAIRAAIHDLGRDAPFKDIQSRVEALGFSVTRQQVSNEKRKLRARYNVEDLPVSVLKKVKLLVDEVGSTEIIRRALHELDQLQRKAEESKVPRISSDSP